MTAATDVTPPAYPSQWESDVVLIDGGTAHLRPIRADDSEQLRDLHSRLSPQTIYFRFFSPLPKVPEGQLHHLVEVDYRDRFALGCRTRRDGRRRRPLRPRRRPEDRGGCVRRRRSSAAPWLGDGDARAPRRGCAEQWNRTLRRRDPARQPGDDGRVPPRRFQRHQPLRRRGDRCELLADAVGRARGAHRRPRPMRPSSPRSAASSNPRRSP